MTTVLARSSGSVTKIQRKRHTFLWGAVYALLIMHRAFVVRLGPNTEPSLGRLEGLVEEVDTAEELRFHSREELLGFLEQRFVEARRLLNTNGSDGSSQSSPQDKVPARVPET